MNNSSYRFLFAAGGTGGHLYPAIAVAEQLELLSPNSKIMFVGTKDKLESKVIPKIGYKFSTIWISGFSRKFQISNLIFPFKLIVSFFQSMFLNLRYKPTVTVGAGAYVSGPVVKSASLLGAKIVLMEQNSFPGVTNRILEKIADSIHISFEDSKKYFKDESKLKITGNPIRLTLKLSDRSEAVQSFSLNADKKVLLVLGGSLGAGSINSAIASNIDFINKNEIQIIWQTGERYYNIYRSYENNMVKISPFISDMSSAYSACDLVVARSGATTIAELAYLGLPTIFIPSSNVAANHQYKNALSIVENNGGILIKDENIIEKLSKLIVESIFDSNLLEKLGSNITKFSKPNAAKEIALDIMNLAQVSKKRSEN